MFSNLQENPPKGIQRGEENSSFFRVCESNLTSMPRLFHGSLAPRLEYVMKDKEVLDVFALKSQDDSNPKMY
jgi:hypothetical protein